MAGPLRRRTSPRHGTTPRRRTMTREMGRARLAVFRFRQRPHSTIPTSGRPNARGQRKSGSRQSTFRPTVKLDTSHIHDMRVSSGTTAQLQARRAASRRKFTAR